MPILTELDVVSFGGHSGGALYFYSGTGSVYFVVFNIGSSSDAFSWRGSLPLSGNVIGWQNSSDTGCSVTAAGVYYLPTE